MLVPSMTTIKCYKSILFLTTGRITVNTIKAVSRLKNLCKLENPKLENCCLKYMLNLLCLLFYYWVESLCFENRHYCNHNNLNDIFSCFVNIWHISEQQTACLYFNVEAIRHRFRVFFSKLHKSFRFILSHHHLVLKWNSISNQCEYGLKFILQEHLIIQFRIKMIW